MLPKKTELALPAIISASLKCMSKARLGCGNDSETIWDLPPPLLQSAFRRNRKAPLQLHWPLSGLPKTLLDPGWRAAASKTGALEPSGEPPGGLGFRGLGV